VKVARNAYGKARSGCGCNAPSRAAQDGAGSGIEVTEQVKKVDGKFRGTGYTKFSGLPPE